MVVDWLNALHVITAPFSLPTAIDLKLKMSVPNLVVDGMEGIIL